MHYLGILGTSSLELVGPGYEFPGASGEILYAAKEMRPQGHTTYANNWRNSPSPVRDATTYATTVHRPWLGESTVWSQCYRIGLKPKRVLSGPQYTVPLRRGAIRRKNLGDSKGRKEEQGYERCSDPGEGHIVFDSLGAGDCDRRGDQRHQSFR